MKKLILLIFGFLPFFCLAYEFQDIAVEIPHTSGGWNVQQCSHLNPGEGFYIIMGNPSSDAEDNPIFFYDKYMSLIAEKPLPGYNNDGFTQIFFNDDDDLEYICREEIGENQIIFKIMQVQSGHCIAQTGVFTKSNKYIGCRIQNIGDNNYLCIIDEEKTIWYLIDKEKINASEPTVIMEAPTNGRMYNLNGQQILEPHGFYILDGEKHLAK